MKKKPGSCSPQFLTKLYICLHLFTLFRQGLNAQSAVHVLAVETTELTWVRCLHRTRKSKSIPPSHRLPFFNVRLLGVLQGDAVKSSGHIN